MRPGFKRTIGLIVATFVAMLGLGVAAAPAQASSSDCPASYTCLWNGIDFSGTPAWKNAMPGTFGACVDVTGTANNNAESIYNRNSFQVSFYNFAGGSGYMFSLAPNAGIGDLHFFPSGGGWQNQISSVCHE